MENLASESNAKKINQRFHELELEILELKETVFALQNSMGNVNNLISKQTAMIQQAWSAQYGSGPTEVN